MSKQAQHVGSRLKPVISYSYKKKICELNIFPLLHLLYSSFFFSILSFFLPCVCFGMQTKDSLESSESRDVFKVKILSALVLLHSHSHSGTERSPSTTHMNALQLPQEAASSRYSLFKKHRTTRGKPRRFKNKLLSLFRSRWSREHHSILLQEILMSFRDVLKRNGFRVNK